MSFLVGGVLVGFLLYCSNSLLAEKHRFSTPRQAVVLLQLPVSVSSALSQAGHSFPLAELLGAGRKFNQNDKLI